MFKARQLNNIVEEKDNCFEVELYSEVETSNGWKYADKLANGDTILVEENDDKLNVKITKIEKLSNKILIYFN